MSIQEIKPDPTGIYRANITTKHGNTLQVLYNPDNELLVVDLVASNEEGGNEVLRQTLNESKLLNHTIGAL